jgi:hypothetical protein
MHDNHAREPACSAAADVSYMARPRANGDTAIMFRLLRSRPEEAPRIDRDWRITE